MKATILQDADFYTVPQLYTEAMTLARKGNGRRKVELEDIAIAHTEDGSLRLHVHFKVDGMRQGAIKLLRRMGT